MSTPREVNVQDATIYPAGAMFQLTGEGGESFGWYWLGNDNLMWAWLQGGAGGAAHWARHDPTSVIVDHEASWTMGDDEDEDVRLYELTLVTGPVAFLYKRHYMWARSPTTVYMGYPFQTRHGGTAYRWTTDPVPLQFDQHGAVWRHRDTWEPETVFVTQQMRANRERIRSQSWMRSAPR